MLNSWVMMLSKTWVIIISSDVFCLFVNAYRLKSTKAVLQGAEAEAAVQKGTEGTYFSISTRACFVTVIAFTCCPCLFVDLRWVAVNHWIDLFLDLYQDLGL